MYTRLGNMLHGQPALAVLAGGIGQECPVKGTTIQMLLFDPKGFLDQAQGSEKRKYDRNLLISQTHSNTGEKVKQSLQAQPEMNPYTGQDTYCPKWPACLYITAAMYSWPAHPYQHGQQASTCM
ncbi:hypothetical protein EV424DRAFT_1353169 [Suillus variegatus]|nr:hypothetical protein EV424DRAFT_1353169 [Suillus variegatus]